MRANKTLLLLAPVFILALTSCNDMQMSLGFGRMGNSSQLTVQIFDARPGASLSIMTMNVPTRKRRGEPAVRELTPIEIGRTTADAKGRARAVIDFPYLAGPLNRDYPVVCRDPATSEEPNCLSESDLQTPGMVIVRDLLETDRDKQWSKPKDFQIGSLFFYYP